MRFQREWPKWNHIKNKPNRSEEIHSIDIVLPLPVKTFNIFTGFEKHRVLSLHDKVH